MRTPTLNGQTNVKKNRHDQLNTSSKASQRQVSANVVVEAVVFDLVGAPSADIGVIISAIQASQRVKARQLLCE